MPNRYNRPSYTRARRRALRRRQLMLAGGVAAVALLVLVIALLVPKGGKRDVVTVAPVEKAPTAEPVAAPEETLLLTEEGADDAQQTPLPTPTPAPTPEPVDSARALTRPTATAPGFIPVFSKAETNEKIIAITVDDCFQANNLEKIVNKALEVGGKLTIFPIGQNAIKEKQSATLKYAWENGFELENHTYTHCGLFNVSTEEMAKEIYMQQMALCYVLGVEYQPHFLRPRGGDARRDQRMQKYAEQLGYYGIAHWSAGGSQSRSSLVKHLEPGAIYLFHTTDSDWDNLEYFIPYAVEQGYQLVTLNEMFSYPANETGELLDDPSTRTPPTPEPYERALVTFKKTTYDWGVWLLQEKLIALGYLDGDPDGVYGPGCEAAIKKYQYDHGLEVTGVADPALQETILNS